ncbi:MAG: hypothetical protein A2Z72_00235 [Omnitrophica bacterium RBG_13_46_9]|nr:MAG: hypothetical protein A2Z72_00235 [Omnitrophica bacterium RBG_13_46_9]
MLRKMKGEKTVEILLKVSRKVCSSLELENVIDMILREAKSFLDTDYSALFLLDEDSRHLVLAGAIGFKSDQIANLKILGSWERINIELVKRVKAIAVNNIQESLAFKSKKIPFSSEKLPLGAFLAVPLKTDSGIIGILMVSNHKKRKKYFTEEDKKLLSTLANNVSIALLNAKLYKNTKSMFLNTITSLVTAVDAKDPYTHGHSERVALYAVGIAEEMKTLPDFLEDIRLSGLLHDIGKIGISDSILSKSTMLNDEEFKKIHEHPNIGLRIVASVINSKNILGGIAEHHERFDGKGYPRQLEGKHISLTGRIVAVADAFDTITTDRPYQKAFTAKEALLEIAGSAGTHFDPGIVKAFQKSFSKHPDLWKFK